MCVQTRCTGCAAPRLVSGTTYDCGAAINYGIDPRHGCTFVSQCKAAFCAGGFGGPVCDLGNDQYGFERPCGANPTCANNAQGVGVKTGVCISSTCQPTQTLACMDGQAAYCYPCSATTGNCDSTKAFPCP
jgi:hypothetical protein